MAVTDLAQRATPLLRSALDDDDLREQLSRAVGSGRSAVKGARARRKAPPQTLLQRAGESVRSAGEALVTLGQIEEPKPKRRGRTLLAVLAAGGLVALLAQRRRGADAQTGDSHGA